MVIYLVCFFLVIKPDCFFLVMKLEVFFLVIKLESFFLIIELDCFFLVIHSLFSSAFAKIKNPGLYERKLKIRIIDNTKTFS